MWITEGDGGAEDFSRATCTRYLVPWMAGEVIGDEEIKTLYIISSECVNADDKITG